MLTNRAALQHTFAALIVILATLAGTLAPVGQAVQPAEARARIFTAAALFEGANFGGAGTFFETSQPDLSIHGWADRISSIRVTGGMVIAAYSGINYTGICEPFIGEDPWLGNNTIGNDTIRSIKLKATCEGEVLDPVIVDMTSVASSSNSVDDVRCPYNYVEKDQDLNQDIGGRYVHICLKVDWLINPGARNFVHDMAAFAENNLPIGGHPPEVVCDEGRPLGVDLNSGAGVGYQFLNYCIYSGSQTYHGPRVFDFFDIVPRDVGFIAYPSDDAPDYFERLTRCEQQFIDVVNGDVPASAVQMGNLDLNRPIDIPWPEPDHTVIRMCMLSYAQLQPDTRPPITTLSSRTPANRDGWNNTAVTVTWKCTDFESGPLEPMVSKTVSTEGSDQSITGVCWDYSDNSASDTQTGINIDLTPPTIVLDGRTPPANATGWNNTSVAFHWVCDDALSGPVSVALARTVAEEGANQSIPATCQDKAGNTATDTQTVSIDKTNPQLNLVNRTTPNRNGWNNTTVHLVWTCTENLSGLAGFTVFQIISTEGAGQSRTGSCEDNAGNTVTSPVMDINIDKTAPVVSFEEHPGSYLVDELVTLPCSASDSLSGIDGGCPGVSSPAYLFQLGPNTVTTSVTDRAGNVADASASFDLVVTVESLATLHERWASNAKVVDSLNQLASNIADAPNDKARNAMLHAYERQLYKRVTPEQGAILLRLVQGL